MRHESQAENCVWISLVVDTVQMTEPKVVSVTDSDSMMSFPVMLAIVTVTYTVGQMHRQTIMQDSFQRVFSPATKRQSKLLWGD